MKVVKLYETGGLTVDVPDGLYSTSETQYRVRKFLTDAAVGGIITWEQGNNILLMGEPEVYEALVAVRGQIQEELRQRSESQI